ncbi:hypothetical protein QAD02_006778 [Eretmocerus hayati]|uniref:Uncharacterized protein n=1 Tax=Eretmocerus hayati TaxID=131215 RepID=A0ACC2N2L8_9HYME|nr:hypothetical protein QAD02_006778 [Eretmocerus hayati]
MDAKASRKQNEPTTEEPPPKYEDIECLHNGKIISAEQCNGRCLYFFLVVKHLSGDSDVKHMEGVCSKGFCECKLVQYFDYIDNFMCQGQTLDEWEKYEMKRQDKMQKKLIKKAKRSYNLRSFTEEYSCNRDGTGLGEFDDPSEPSCSSWLPRDFEESE